MRRTIASVVLGYVVIFAVVIATFSLAYLLLGPDRAFQPGTYDVSALWLVVSIVLGFTAAVIGGWICAWVARSPSGPRSLAVVVLVLGFAMSVPALMETDAAVAGVRDSSVGNSEAMMNAEQPVWIVLLNPLIGAAGVLVGARLVGGERREPADA